MTVVPSEDQLRAALLPLSDTLDPTEGPVLLAWSVDALARALWEQLSGAHVLRSRLDATKHTPYAWGGPPGDPTFDRAPRCLICGWNTGEHGEGCPSGRLSPVAREVCELSGCGAPATTLLYVDGKERRAVCGACVQDWAAARTGPLAAAEVPEGMTGAYEADDALVRHRGGA